MLFRLSPKDGIIPCIHAVFQLVGRCDSSCRIVYVNNSTPGPLRKALGESKEGWVSDPEMMKAFLYERVTSLLELLELLRQDYTMIIIEHLDTIVQEPSDKTYSELNQILAKIMQEANGAIFIDDWEYLLRYFIFEDISAFHSVEHTIQTNAGTQSISS